MVFGNPNAFVSTGKLVLNQGGSSRSGDRAFMAEEREKIIESELKGVTLRVYWHILGSKKQVVGVRPVQRALGLSSPSVALHHLEKLKDLGLLEKDSTGEYHLIELVEVEAVLIMDRAVLTCGIMQSQGPKSIMKERERRAQA